MSETVDVVEFGDNYIYPIQIDCLSQYSIILENMKREVKKLLAKRSVWLYGVNLEIKSIDIQSVSGDYGGVSFIVAVEFAEETWRENQKFPLAGTLTMTVNAKA